LADLNVTYDYLDDLVASLTLVAKRVRLDDVSANVDHSVAGSADVESTGNEVAKFQASLSTTLADNVDTLAASVGDVSTTLAETDTQLSAGASGGAHGGGNSGGYSGGGGAF
jgi:hypothetical protein